MAGSNYKRGIVRENDPKKCRSRVEFSDEDETVSHWLYWNMAAAGGAKIYNQPDVGAQVNCLIDENGEDGAIMGANYSSADPPPTTNGNLTKLVLGGVDIEIDKSSGAGTLKFGGPLIIEAASITIKGPVKIEGELKIEGASVTHNGRNIGETHKHSGVEPGSAKTGTPD